MVEVIKTEIEATTEVLDDEISEDRDLKPSKVRSDIKAGKRWQRQGHYDGADDRWKRWERNQKYLMCDWGDDFEDDVIVNTVFSNFNTVRPTLYFKNPEIRAEPTQPNFKRVDGGEVAKDERGYPVLVDNAKAGRFMGIKINYHLKQLKFKKVLKKVIGDVLAPYGVGWIKWGYQDITTRDQIQADSTVKGFWCERVDPRYVVYDYLATDGDETRFKAELLVLTKKQAKDEGMDIPEDYVASLPDFLKEKANKVNGGDDDDDLVLVWEYHDEVERRIYWLLDRNEESDTSLEEGWAKDPVDDPYPFEGSCYVPLVLNDNNDDLIGLSDVEPIEDQVLQISAGRTKQSRHVRNYGTVTYYEEGAILNNELDNIKTNDHGAYVRLEEGKFGKFQVHPTPSMGADDFNMDSLNKSDMQTTLGITDFQQGIAGSDTTATEAGIIQNAANIRISEKRDVIADYVLENVERLSALIQTFSEAEEWVKISDIDLEEDFVGVLEKEHGFNPKLPFLHMKKEDYQGQFNFEFKVDDMIQKSPEVEAQQWIQYVSTVAPLQGVLEKEGVSISKIAIEVAKLMGLNLDKVRETGPAQISAAKEDFMFQQGMEVPEAHDKDIHDEHILSHQKVKAEIETQLQQLAQQIAQFTQIVQNGLVQDPAILQQLQGLSDQSQQKGDQLQMMLRRVTLHMQQHALKQAAKAGPAGLPQGPAPDQAAPDPNVGAQAAIQGQAGAV